jgi:transposase
MMLVSIIAHQAILRRPGISILFDTNTGGRASKISPEQKEAIK